MSTNARAVLAELRKNPGGAERKVREERDMVARINGH
jgi:hypothetical protein